MLRLVLVFGLCVGFALCDTLFFRPFGSWGKGENKDDSGPNPLCPDKQGTCPDKSTCCKLVSGKYGCCPLPNAVCCSDHTHCCPEGFICDLTIGSCRKGNLVIDWLQQISTKKTPGEELKNQPALNKVVGVRPGVALKQEPTYKKPVKNFVPCPGKKVECPSGNTCCQLTDKSYGCCPLPTAVCCSDHKHCCPNGYKCSSTSTCIKSDGQGSVTWLALVLGKNRQDNKVNETTSLLTLDVAKKTSNVVCQGGKYQCPGDETCCKLPSGQWGCCPLSHAMCCSDGVHCCPSGYKCSVSTGQCLKAEDDHSPKFTKMMTKLKATPVSEVEVNMVVCPGGKFQCPTGATCCKSPSGWGCCPMSKAVCCSDGMHCCPQGNTCDLKHGKCLRNTPSTSPEMPFLKITDDKKVVMKKATCPDNVSTCPDETTCCKMKNGYYGCCQYEHAICCDDFIHCCPQDMQCNTTSGTCGNALYTLKFGEPLSAKKRILKTGIQCPDKKSSCPAETTCCQMSSGAYGCCPFEKAQCCSDHVHCCPSDEKCDVKGGKCVSKTNRRTDWKIKFAATPEVESEENKDGKNVLCPDKSTKCNAGYTCCETDAHYHYGCCPLLNAVCCSDRRHCCPHGTKCDTAVGRCNKADGWVDWVNRLPNKNIMKDAVDKDDKVPITVLSSAKKANVIVCGNGSAHCDAGQTCCKLSETQWGCCPYEKAICCSDNKHCCPNDYKCNISTNKCVKKGEASIPWFTKRPALPSPLINVGDVICPDQSTCDDGNTCCKTMTGQYGCCPLPSAVCCSDGLHCCPQDTTCDVTAGRCLSTVINSLSTSWYTVKQTLKFRPVGPTLESNRVCPGKKARCPHDQTCCKLDTGDYGCCPLPDAVCCSDGKHCCPHGSTCDPSSGMCQGAGELSESSMPLGDLLPATVRKVAIDSSLGNIVCPDKKASCHHDNTCCKLSSGSYGCCPLPAAVCCSDGEHCCPHGTTCDTATGACTSNSLTVPWDHIQTKPNVAPTTNKMPLTFGHDVICPDKTSHCNDDATCCKLPTGNYGCCPLSAAVCCSDGLHCCPHGSTCNLAAGTCVKTSNGLTVRWDTVQTKPNSVKNIGMPQTVGHDVICPDKKSHCTHEETCCKLLSGSYGCCPYPAATCCSDGQHCCPHGSTCDLAAGKCTSTTNSLAITWDHIRTKPQTAHKDEVSLTVGHDVICPDKKSHCTHEETCCKLTSGSYGCCPYPAAVCCSDGKHCCPHGTTCDTAEGSCKSTTNSLAVTWNSIRTKPLTAHKDEVSLTVGHDVICPDKKSHCTHEETCCKLTSGSYGCCPYPAAVCCSDGKHCCPHGTTCDTAEGSCKSTTNSLAVTWNSIRTKPQKVPKPDLLTSVERDVVCPDYTSQCPQGQTCCKLSTGNYGCCPLPNATCCSDGLHCCPHGSKCNTKAGTCTSTTNGLTLTWNLINKSTKVSDVVNQKPNRNVICHDMSECSPGQSCCPSVDGEFLCCPFENATCCPGSRYCCPSNQVCSETNGCTFATAEQSQKTRVEAIVCPDKSECPWDTTCCNSTGGKYSCCTGKNAVCCPDNKTCCPSGYKCAEVGGKTTCQSATTGFNIEAFIHSRNTAKVPISIPWKEKVPAKPLPGGGPVSDSIICPDKVHECPNYTTCCRMGENWGCCPMKQAVCCSDGKHCCPPGYECDPEHMSCRRRGPPPPP